LVASPSASSEKIIRDNVASNDRDIVEVYFLIAILVIVVFTRWARSEEAGWSLSPKLRPIPERLKEHRLVKLMPSLGFVLIFLILIAVPLVKNNGRNYIVWTEVVLFAMLGLSLSMLTGWAGQLSLGQYTLFGLGGLTTIALRAGTDIPVPFDLYDIPRHKFGWLPAVLIATTLGVLVAFVIGLPALRVKGLFLTVATVAFAVAASGLAVQASGLHGTQRQRRDTAGHAAGQGVRPRGLQQQHRWQKAVLLHLSGDHGRHHRGDGARAS
jgi:hypothetical protein